MCRLRGTLTSRCWQCLPSPELCNEVVSVSYEHVLEYPGERCAHAHTQVCGCRMNYVLVTLVTALIPPSLPLCRTCGNPCAPLFDGKATHLMLVDTTYHLCGCHLYVWGLCCQQVLGETEEEERGLQLYNYYVVQFKDP